MFSQTASSVLIDLRRTVGSVLCAIPGVRRAVDVAERLDLDRSLAWKLWQVGQGRGELPAAKHIPGRQGFERFFERVQRAGLPSEQLADLRAAVDRFEALMRDHAGDRAAADIMLGSLTDEGRRRLERALRRDGFRANCYTLGVQTSTRYNLDVVLSPTPDGASPPDVSHVARLRAHFGLRRMRAELSWPIHRTFRLTPTGPAHVRARPLDPARASDQTPGSALLEQFCSKPLPALGSRAHADHVHQEVLLPSGVGRSAAIDVVAAELFELRSSPGTRDAVTLQIATPTEELVYDVALPALAGGPPRLRVYSTVHGPHPFLDGDEVDLIPVMETLDPIGDPARAPAVAEVPHHADMMRWVFSLDLMAGRQLTLYRLRMSFPPIPVCVAVSYNLVR